MHGQTTFKLWVFACKCFGLCVTDVVWCNLLCVALLKIQIKQFGHIR